MTDFNYSKCFSFAINISNTNMDLFSNNFNDYLKNNSYFYRFEIQISVIGPYVRYTYLKYFFDDKEKVLLESSDTPFDISHRIYTDALNHFIENEHLELLNADMLQVKVPEIKLELRGEDVSVYNCLFEDSSSFYPYLK